jgi:hypothetical protein
MVVVTERDMDLSCAVRSRLGPPTLGIVREESDERRAPGTCCSELTGDWVYTLERVLRTEPEPDEGNSEPTDDLALVWIGGSCFIEDFWVQGSSLSSSSSGKSIVNASSSKLSESLDGLVVLL